MRLLQLAVVALQVLLVAFAGAIAFLPLPPTLVERYYADWLYPSIQSNLTSWSNQTGVSLFDFALAFGVLLLLATWSRSVVGAVKARSTRPVLRALRATVVIIAITYVWFAIAWGLNYSRMPLEASIGYDATRVNAAAVQRLAERAVEQANRTHAAAHAAGFPARAEVPPALVRALHDVERRLGRPAPTVPTRPKRTLLAPFFRASAVDGMHAPFLLETLLNSELTPPERPAVLAHEWAHLAGYAPEDDASFVGLLAALRAGPAGEYSAWLTLVFDATSQVPPADRPRVLGRLAEGPKKDQEAIIQRLQMRVEVVHRASWETYDRYLKAQGIDEGVRNYSRVVQLLVGSGALDWQ